MKKLSDLFHIRYGNSLELNRLKVTRQETGIPFISRKMGDNGIAAYVAPIPGVTPNPAGELTCALSGNGVLTTHIQDRPYYTAFHVSCLRPKRHFTKPELLYYCASIKANRYRYSWGRQANRTLKGILVPEPADIPSWVRSADVNVFNGKDAPASLEPVPALHPEDWRPFQISDLFTLKKGKRLTKANMIPGNTPFIGAIDGNNGVTACVGQPPSHPENTITVNYNGSVAEAFYQPKPYRCTDDVNVLYPRFPLTPEVALFLTTIIRMEKYRFNYGRKWHLERMVESSIRLPVTAEGKPDWAFMAEYIRTLPFSSNL